MEHNKSQERPNHLAWHETLEIHELVAFQAVSLVKLKKVVRDIGEKELKSLFIETINNLEKNISELLEFFPLAPETRDSDTSDDPREDPTPFYAGDLLGLAKTSVRNYAIAITETATPMLRDVLTGHLINAIKSHAKIFNFMYSKSFYPSYDLNKLLQNDVRIAKKAISTKY